MILIDKGELRISGKGDDIGVQIGILLNRLMKGVIPKEIRKEFLMSALYTASEEMDDSTRLEFADILIGSASEILDKDLRKNIDETVKKIMEVAEDEEVSDEKIIESLRKIANEVKE